MARQSPIRVAVGEWIYMPAPEGAFPVHMQVGPAPAQPAFIDYQKTSAGVQRVAALRCPALPPGTYTARLSHADGSATADVIVS